MKPNDFKIGEEYSIKDLADFSLENKEFVPIQHGVVKPGQLFLVLKRIDDIDFISFVCTSIENNGRIQTFRCVFMDIYV